MDFDKRRDQQLRCEPRGMVKQSPHARESRGRWIVGKVEKSATWRTGKNSANARLRKTAQADTLAKYIGERYIEVKTHWMPETITASQPADPAVAPKPPSKPPRTNFPIKALAARLQQMPGKARPVVSTCLYGLVASLAAVAFQLVIGWIYQICYRAPSTGSFGHFAAISFAAIVFSSLLAGWLLTSFCPEAAGSGIPQVKLAYWKEFGYAPRRIAWIKFLAGAVSIGGGQSLGREGPTVQIGGNLASTVAGMLGVSKQNRRTASAAGAAAGLAAAFNAPLASVAFVLEEIIGDLNSRSLGTVLMAAVIGAFVVHACIGAQPAFVLPAIGEPTWRAYLVMPFAAALAALAGALFQRATLDLRAAARKRPIIPRWLHPLAAGLATWLIGITVFKMSGRLGVFALGYDDLSDALAHGMAWKLAALLLAGKLIATILCYGLGGCGGIFSPNLFFGGMAGAVVAGIAGHFVTLNESDYILLAVGGMSAGLGAAVQAPVTAILIIFEMTHQFSLVPGLMLAGLVSQLIARRINPVSFYEEALEQDGHKMEHLIPPRDLRSWHSLPISAIASFKPVVITDMSEPVLKELLDGHPYRQFPVVIDDRLAGIATRAEIEAALTAHRPFKIEPMASARPSDTIRDSQNLLIESPCATLALSDTPEGKPLGIVTLHDILRAQVAMSDREG
jgi:CIC family chloride channel protein